MRAVVVWKEKSDYAKEVRTWIRDFQKRTGKEIESIDPETMLGESFVKAYGIVEYPTFLGIDDSGKVLEMWKGKLLPLIDKVSYYANEKKSDII